MLYNVDELHLQLRCETWRKKVGDRHVTLSWKGDKCLGMLLKQRLMRLLRNDWKALDYCWRWKMKLKMEEAFVHLIVSICGPCLSSLSTLFLMEGVVIEQTGRTFHLSTLARDTSYGLKVRNSRDAAAMCRKSAAVKDLR